ncbi:MAG: metal-dependent hydrolase [Deltaproteobacteria bacterium]|nr:metal-dependent hydrolase [Deltaproteobacteria bacterium]
MPEQIDRARHSERFEATSGVVIWAALLVALFIPIDLLGEARPGFMSRGAWAVYDGFMHGFQAVAVAIPILARAKFLTLKALAVAFVAGMALDLDHFVLAESVSLADAIAITQRPPTHSLAFAAAVGAVTLLWVRRPLMAWIVTASLAAHVLRDASTWVTPWLNPFRCSTISPVAYYVGIAALAVVPAFVFNYFARRSRERSQALAESEARTN